MKRKYKYLGLGRYQVQLQDGTWTDVRTDKDGNFIYKDADGKEVIDNPKGEIEGEPAVEILHTGYGGMKHVSPRTYQYEQANLIKPSDPSENAGNDLLFMGVPRLGIVGAKSLFNLGKIAVNSGKNLYQYIVKSIAENGVKQTAKQAAKATLKSTPVIVGGFAAGARVDKVSQSLTGKPWDKMSVTYCLIDGEFQYRLLQAT